MVSSGTLNQSDSTLRDQGLSGECIRRLVPSSTGEEREAVFSSLLFRHTSFNCGNRAFRLFVTVSPPPRGPVRAPHSPLHPHAPLSPSPRPKPSPPRQPTPLPTPQSPFMTFAPTSDTSSTRLRHARVHVFAGALAAGGVGLATTRVDARKRTKASSPPPLFPQRSLLLSLSCCL